MSRITTFVAAFALCAAAHAATPFVDVGKQEPITILTPSTPWLPAFTKIVETYEEQTGNKVKLDVNPFGAVLEKARNDLRGSGGAYDAVLLDTQWTIEMYEGGFLSPFADIDSAFTPPKELLTYDDSGYWNEQKRWRTSKGGKLMAFTVLGNVPVWYYRTDVLKSAQIVKAIVAFRRRPRLEGNLTTQAGALYCIGNDSAQGGATGRRRKKAFGGIAGFPGRLNGHLGRVLNLHALVDINGNVGRVQQASEQQRGRGQERGRRAERRGRQHEERRADAEPAHDGAGHEHLHEQRHHVRDREHP